MRAASARAPGASSGKVRTAGPALLAVNPFHRVARNPAQRCRPCTTGLARLMRDCAVSRRDPDALRPQHGHVNRGMGSPSGLEANMVDARCGRQSPLSGQRALRHALIEPDQRCSLGLAIRQRIVARRLCRPAVGADAVIQRLLRSCACRFRKVKCRKFLQNHLLNRNNSIIYMELNHRHTNCSH